MNRNVQSIVSNANSKSFTQLAVVTWDHLEDIILPSQAS